MVLIYTNRNKRVWESIGACVCVCALQCVVNGEGEIMLLSAGSESRRGNLPRQTNQRGGDSGQRMGEGGGLS